MALFGPFSAPFWPIWVQKSSWSLILSSLPYFNILHYPNVTSLSCKGWATFSFCIFCIRVAPALLDWSWARCDEHVTIETRTSIFRLYVRTSVRPSVRTYKSLNIKKFLSVFLDIAYLTLFPPGECHATPFVTHGHIPH